MSHLPSRLRTLLFKLLVSAAALLACACAGLVDNAGAAQAVRLEAPIARIAKHSGAKPVRRSDSHRGCSRSRARRRRKGRAACHSRRIVPHESHAARNRPLRDARTSDKAPTVKPKTPSATAPSVASIVASVLATPCQNTELAPEPDNIEAIDTATLCLVDQERARNGELPLRPNAKLERAAQGHSEEMVSDDYFAHVAPSGLTPVGRIEATGYVPDAKVGYTLGENIAWGTLQLSTPSAIVAAWIASPEHLANILYSPYVDTAIGVAPEAPAALAEGEAGAVYSQEFGVIVH
ncbi:MAG: CAP domain-containing protein [Solirubrobacteraceae bacterium]